MTAPGFEPGPTKQTVKNVYVITTQYGQGRHASGKDRILRFPAGRDTSTPNMIVGLPVAPSVGPAVSSRSGRIAFSLTNGEIEVRDRNLVKLYSIVAGFGSYGFPISLAYDHSGNLWVGGWLGTDMGELDEYYGDDTKPDNVYHIPNLYDDYPPYAVAFDESDHLYVQGRFHVWTDCNTTSGCTNTTIPSFSNFLDEYFAYIAPMAVIGRAESRQVVEATQHDHIRYFSPTGRGTGGKWRFTHRSQRCTEKRFMFIADISADVDKTLYLTCEVLGAGTSGAGSARGASTILELYSDGHSNRISGLTNPDGAGAF